MKQQFFFAQKAFIVHDNRLLLVRKSAEDPNQAGRWEVPGGRMDFGEDVDPHLVREVKEEVGLDVEPGAPFHVWQWQLERGTSDGEMVKMQIVAVARFCIPLSLKVSADGQVQEDYLDEIQWVPINQVLEYDLIPNMIPVVQSFLKNVELGFLL